MNKPPEENKMRASAGNALKVKAFLAIASALCIAGAVCAETVRQGSLYVEKARDGVSWVCGADGGRIVGVGRVNVKQEGWTSGVASTQCGERVVFRFSAHGGKGAPERWTLRMPLAHGASKESVVVKPGRWRRHAAGREAQPVETSLGKYKVIRSAHGNVMFRLPGNENWAGPAHESIEFREDGQGGYRRDLTFFAMRDGEEVHEACARVNGLPYALRLGTPLRNNLYAGGDVQLDCAVSETSGRDRKGVPFALTVRDWDGCEVLALRSEIDLPAFARRTGRRIVNAPPRGIYFVELSVGSGEEEEFTRTTFAVIPPFDFSRRPDDLFFGLCLRTGRAFAREMDAEYALAARLGFRYLRSGDDRTARRHGMRSGILRQMPRHDFRSGNAEDARTVSGWLDAIAESGAPIFEFGNEIGHFRDTAERHVLYDRYNGWLDAIRAARAERCMDFKLMYGTSARRPELMRLIADKGILGKLDLFVVHPGRLNWTPDQTGSGWRYRGLVQGSKRIYAELGYGGTPIFLTETYTRSKPNDRHSDSLRQTAESAVLNAVIAKADGMANFCAFQLHEGVSYNENGIDTSDVEYSYGILNRDNSLKPAAIGYETAAEELDGAAFVKEVRLEGRKLRGFAFSTPSGPLAVLWDRTEGYDLRSQGPRPRRKGERFFHFEPWLGNWRVKAGYALKAAAREVSVRDAIGRVVRIPAENGRVSLALTGAPVFVRGLDLDQFSGVSGSEPPVRDPEGEYERNAQLY